MWDKTVEGIGLMMRVENLENIPQVDLPERYGWRLYHPGDEEAWADMWTSAEGFSSRERALASFHREFPAGQPMDKRMIFLTDNGVPFATATAWYGKDGPDGEEGRLHWVCVDEAHQGQKLSGALIALSMKLTRELGHKNAILYTQTPCWVAIRMYNKFGFRPVVNNEKDIRGWQIVTEKSGVDFMKMIEEDKE